MKTFLAAFFLLIAANSNANPVRLTFTADNFSASRPGPIPISSIEGSFLLSNSPEASAELIGIDLTLNGKMYELADVLVDSWAGYLSVGAKASGVNGVQFGTDDFVFRLDSSRGQFDGLYFIYTVQGEQNSFISYSSAFTFTTQVPEPSSTYLMPIGIAFLVLRNRLQKSKR